MFRDYTRPQTDRTARGQEYTSGLEGLLAGDEVEAHIEQLVDDELVQLREERERIRQEVTTLRTEREELKASRDELKHDRTALSQGKLPKP